MSKATLAVDRLISLGGPKMEAVIAALTQDQIETLDTWVNFWVDQEKRKSACAMMDAAHGGALDEFEHYGPAVTARDGVVRE